MSCTAFLAFALSLVGCSRTEQLRAAEQHLANARWEAASANLEDLAPQFGQLTENERTQFCWLRGITALQLGNREDARHWLALALASLTLAPGALNAAQRVELERRLDELVPPQGAESDAQAP